MRKLISITSIIIVLVTISSCIEKEMSQLLIDAKKVVLPLGGKIKINSTIFPNSDTEENVQWHTSDGSIAIVDKNGNVEAVGYGTTTIRAEFRDTMAECVISVKEIEEISFDALTYTLIEGQTNVLEINTVPEYSVEYEHIISTDDPTIISVDNNAMTITALKEGKTTITITSGQKTSDAVCIVKKKPQIGDYYYSDGTYTSEYVEEKEVLGIVFYSGNPGANDMILSARYPDCINGLAVGLHEDVVSWQSNYMEYGGNVGDWIESEDSGYYLTTVCGFGIDALINKIIGYNNTKGIELFNSSPDNIRWKVNLTDKLAQYRDEHPLPEFTSEWYIPSIKELSLLTIGETSEDIWKCGGIYQYYPGVINMQLGKLSKVHLLDANSYYWSSSEYNHAMACCVYFLDGCVFSDYKNKENKLRYIFAF